MTTATADRVTDGRQLMRQPDDEAPSRPFLGVFRGPAVWSSFYGVERPGVPGPFLLPPEQLATLRMKFKA